MCMHMHERVMCMPVCVCMRAYVCVHVRVCARACVRVCIRVRACMCVSSEETPALCVCSSRAGTSAGNLAPVPWARWDKRCAHAKLSLSFLHQLAWEGLCTEELASGLCLPPRQLQPKTPGFGAVTAWMGDQSPEGPAGKRGSPAGCFSGNEILCTLEGRLAPLVPLPAC